MMNNSIIIVKEDNVTYNKEGSFRPSEQYPEYRFKDCLSEECNKVYEMVREVFRLACYDLDSYGTEKWNPLGNLIKKGDMIYG